MTILGVLSVNTAAELSILTFFSTIGLCIYSSLGPLASFDLSRRGGEGENYSTSIGESAPF